MKDKVQSSMVKITAAMVMQAMSKNVMVTTTGIVCCNNPTFLEETPMADVSVPRKYYYIVQRASVDVLGYILGRCPAFTIADDFLHIFSVYILFQQLYFYSFGKVRALQCRADAVKHFEIKSHSGTK